MRIVTKAFFDTSSIEKTEGTIAAMDFLASPVSVSKMIAATENHMPALSGVVEELEERFGESDTFPLNHDGEDKHAPNRRNVGWMVRFIMREYGYSPVANSERTRIGSNSGSKYFRNAAVYEKTDEEPNYVILNSTMITSRFWHSKDMMIGKDDSLYKETRERMKNAGKRLRTLKMGKDFLLTYLMRTGFNNCISLFNIGAIFMGLQVPCPELSEAIENALLLFERFDYVDSTRDKASKNDKEEWIKSSLPSDPESKYILSCCLESDQDGIGITLTKLFENNAAGLYWKAKRDDFLPLVEFAKNQYSIIPKKTPISKGTEKYYYLKSNFKSIAERVTEMSESSVELDERNNLIEFAEEAKDLLDQFENNPKKLNLMRCYELVTKCWEGLNDWTITYRFLGSLVSVEKKWITDEISIHELWVIAEQMINDEI